MRGAWVKDDKLDPVYILPYPELLNQEEEKKAKFSQTTVRAFLRLMKAKELPHKLISAAGATGLLDEAINNG